MLLNSKSFLIILTLSFMFVGCNKDKNNMVDYDYGVKVTSDYVNAQHINVSLANTYFKAIYDSVLMADGKSEIDGATVRYYPDSIYQLRISYPSWGTDDGYGNWRQGEIFVKADGGFFNVEEKCQINFLDFNFSKDTIKADLFEITYIGLQGANDIFELTSINERRCFEDSTGIVTFDSKQQFQIIKNQSNGIVPEFILINGDIEGISRDSSVFVASISSSFLSDLSCNWMKSGETSLVFPEASFGASVFYSDTAICDNWYNLVIDDIDFPSKIKKPKWVN